MPSITGEAIETRFNLAPDLGVCFVDKNQIIQILVNLADNGVGMDAKTTEAVFEPFYSTKEARKGVGLGLATAYGVIKQSGGFIWVESAKGRGTTFKIQFPRIDQPMAAKPEEKAAAADETMPEGSETILLVDDEDAVRRLTSDVLKMLGYNVLEAETGAQALETMQSSPAEPPQLLLTDVEMPQISGRQVAEKFTVLYPDASVLFISGDIESTISHHAIPSRENFYYLSKPFSPSELAQKVRRILDS